VTGTVSALTEKESYNLTEASISVPDNIYEGEDFFLSVEGELLQVTSWGLYRYAVLENAEWYYDSNHNVIVTSYDAMIDYVKYSWGSTLSKSYALNKEEGTYQYTLVFSDYRYIHRAYGVAVDIEFDVKKKCVPPEEIDRYIQSLPDIAFKNDNGNLKKAFHEKIKVVYDQMHEERYQNSIDKLEHDILDKIHKWITDEDAREELVEMVETLIECLERLIALQEES
jgi:hypothetical protein